MCWQELYYIIKFTPVWRSYHARICLQIILREYRKTSQMWLVNLHTKFRYCRHLHFKNIEILLILRTKLRNIAPYSLRKTSKNTPGLSNSNSDHDRFVGAIEIATLFVRLSQQFKSNDSFWLLSFEIEPLNIELIWKNLKMT